MFLKTFKLDNNGPFCGSCIILEKDTKSNEKQILNVLLEGEDKKD